MSGLNGGGLFLENGAQSAEDAVDEHEANKIVARIMAEVAHRRRMLTLQELCDMENPRAGFEQFFPTVQGYFYTVDGRLNGEEVRGAMFAGGVALVFAPTRARADEFAQEGVETTIALAKEYAFREYLGCPPAANEGFENLGIEIEAHKRGKPH